MVEQALWRFLESPKRKQAVIIGTILTGLVAVWPAADEYMAAEKRLREAQSALEDSQQQIDKLPKFVQVYEKRQAELQKLEKATVDEKAAQLVQSQLRKIVRDTKCTMRKIKLGDPLVRDWSEGDSPVSTVAIGRSGGDTPFRLATRQMQITITGAMPNISKFLKELNGVDRLIHTKTISLQRSSASKETRLDMDLWLFDLSLKSKT